MHPVRYFLIQTLLAGAVLATTAAHAGSFAYTALVLPDSKSPAYLAGIYQDQAIGWGDSANAYIGFVWSHGNYTLVPQFSEFDYVSDNGLVLGDFSSSDYTYAILKPRQRVHSDSDTQPAARRIS